jgi:hypothetical protein
MRRAQSMPRQWKRWDWSEECKMFATANPSEGGFEV